MALQLVDIGSAPNAGDGESPRTAFDKVNDNFTEVYGAVATAESDIDTLQASMVTAEGSIDDLLDQLGNGVITSTVTTKQNDYAPTGWAACRVLRWNGAGSTGITGFDVTGIADGAEKTIVNASTNYLLWLENQNTASAAASRMLLPDSFPAFLMPGDSITLFYDLTAARWRVRAWPTRGQAMGLHVFADFCGYISPSRGTGDWGYISSGTGATLSIAGTKVDASIKHTGSIWIDCGTTTTGYCAIGGYSAILKPGNAAILVVGQINVDTAANGTDTFTVRCGIARGEAADASASGTYWEYRWNGSATELSQTVVQAGSFTRSTSGSPAASTAESGAGIKLAVFRTQAGTRADFLYSTDNTTWVLAGSGDATGQTNTSGLTCGIIKSAGTTARKNYLDYFGYRVDGARA